MNILVTLNAKYLHPLTVMLKSLAVNNPGRQDVYVLSRDLTEENLDEVRAALREPQIRLILCRVEQTPLQKAPTSRRYPMAIYDRLFAAEYLPGNLERILYLDPDLVVLRPLYDLYNTPLTDNLYAAASHVGKIGEIYNSIRVDAGEIVPYFNSGVLLMNLDRIRTDQDPKEITNYISVYRDSLMLPDQDVLTALYGKRIVPLDPYLYNMTERMLTKEELNPKSEVDAQWVFDHSVIVHYVGRNKPWHPHYIGKLDCLYRKYEDMLR